MKLSVRICTIIIALLTATIVYSTQLTFPIIHRAPKEQWCDFLGYKIASPIGIAACKVTTSEGIWLAARLGCDVLTYKTIRCYPWSAHPQPNIVTIDRFASIAHDDIGTTIVADDEFDLPKKFFAMHNDVCSGDITIANSFGINSADPEWTRADIRKAKQSLLEGQVLIVSIFGNTVDEWIAAAQLAAESGADIIEANFSCPNLNTHNEPIYVRPDDIFSITQALVHAVPVNIPVIIKCGVFVDHVLMRQALLAAAHAGARGICGINTVPMRVVNSDGMPMFGKRMFAGVSGAAIQSLALDFITTASMIIRDENLNIIIIGVGGITMAKHFSQFLAAGATVALSATGMMYNPCLAAEFQKEVHDVKAISTVNKQELANKLFDMGVIKFGDFVFKSGIRSNNYVDMRLAISDPDVLQMLAACLHDIQKNCSADLLCPVPYAAVPVTTVLSLVSGVPMIMARKEAKDHGTKKMIEGIYTSGQECLLIEDVVTTGLSILETVKVVEDAGLIVKNVVVLIDRQQGGRENITRNGYRLHALFTLEELLDLLKKSNRISQEIVDMVQSSKKVILHE